MSIYDINSDNEFKARMKMFMCDDIFQLNRDTGEYERLSHSGGPDPITELPYYLKSNNIRIDNGTISNTVMDSNSFDVVDIVNDKSSSLLADKLVLGDTSGNSELDKTKIDLLTQLNLGVTVNPMATSTTISTISPIVYNTTDKKFYRAQAIRLGTASSATQVGSAYVTIQGNTAAVGLTNTALNIFGLSGGQFLKGESGVLYVYNNIDKNQAILNKDGLRIGTLQDTGYQMNMLKSNLSLTKNALSIFDETSGTTTTANLASFTTLNKIRDMTDMGLNHDMKMILYNTATNNFSYKDITYQWMSANDLRNRTAGNPLASTNRVLMHEAGTGAFTYVNLNDTFAAANKIRDMASGSVDANKRMVIYDTTTTNISYVPVPSGSGSLPDYIYNDKIEMASTGGGYIKTQNPSGSSAAAITKTGVLELTNAAGQRNDLDSLGVKFVNENKNDKFYVFYEKFHQTDPNRTIRLGFWDDGNVTAHVNPNTFVINDADLGNPYQEMKYTEGRITLDLKFVNGGSGFVNQTSKFIFLEDSGLNLHDNPYHATADQILDINYTPRMTDDTHGIMPTFSVTLCRLKINKSPTMIDKYAIHVECNTAGASSSTEFKGYLSFRIVKRGKMNINSQNEISY